MPEPFLLFCLFIREENSLKGLRMRRASPFRRRDEAKLNSSSGDASDKEKRLDRWFLRAAHVAAVSGVVLAIFGYFYTVRPIYQKALLDEAIARKETEMKTLTKALEESYLHVRTFTAKNFANLAAAECSGLLETNVLAAIPGKQTERFSAEKELLASDIKVCAQRVTNKFRKPFDALRKQDETKLLAAFEQGVIALNAKQTNALQRIRALPELAAKDSSAFVPLGPFTQRLYDMKIFPPELKEKEFARAVERTQSAIVHSFRDEVRAEFQKLSDTQLWN